MKLETKRLILRTPRVSDWKDIVEGVGEFDVAKMTENIPHPYKKKDALWWIERAKKETRKKISYVFAIELKSEKKIIGVIDLCRVEKFSGTARTGSWINKKYWRKGYITEAKIAENNFAFNNLKLRKLNSTVFIKNNASNKTQKSVGYKLEGLKKKDTKSLSTGEIRDVYIYGLLKEDWNKNLPKLKKRLIKKQK